MVLCAKKNSYIYLVPISSSCMHHSAIGAQNIVSLEVSCSIALISGVLTSDTGSHSDCKWVRGDGDHNVGGYFKTGKHKCGVGIY
jgi:hypothetical protein